MKENLKLTSVKILPGLFEDFKVKCVLSKGFTFQKLVNRAMHMYVNNPDFKSMMENYNNLITSGSL